MLKLTEKNYHAAIIENFPQLSIETWEPLHEGWANRTFLVNQGIVFRFPKHQVAAHDLVREIRLLTELAPTVPLSIPQYLYYGQPTQHYPFVFGGYAFIEGTPLNQCSPEVQSASWWQPSLGAFLTALHRFPIDRAQDLFETDTYTTPQAWQDGVAKMLEKIQNYIFPRLTHRQQEELSTYFEQVMADPSIFSFTPVLIHQDFYSHNILVDVDMETVTGIIDWGSWAIGDPAEDVGDLVAYYDGVIDDNWHSRCAFYRRTAPFPDLLYVLEHNQHEKVASIMDKIDALWTP